MTNDAIIDWVRTLRKQDMKAMEIQSDASYIKEGTEIIEG
jgi:hypothetical protein